MTLLVAIILIVAFVGASMEDGVRSILSLLRQLAIVSMGCVIPLLTVFVVWHFVAKFW